MKLLCLVTLFMASQVVLAQLSPTEQLNQQRQAQLREQQRQIQQSQQAAQNARRIATRRLQPPCVVPDSYYPLRTCAVSTSATACGRGYNAWPTFAECCQRGSRGAFPQGCTDFSRNVTCWIPENFYPDQTCQQSNDISRCSYNWGTWATEQACCAPGAAHPDGCSRLSSQCYVATEWSPSRKCGLVTDVSTCTRGWGAYGSVAECCEEGNAFPEGCFDYEATQNGDGFDRDFSQDNFLPVPETEQEVKAAEGVNP